MAEDRRRIRVLGVGMGPQHVTPEVADALSSVAYVVAVAKSADDSLLAIRRAVCDAQGVPLVVVPDPPRSAEDGYEEGVRDWYAARVDAYAAAVVERPGDVGFLVWGDPSLYDGTMRVVGDLAARLGCDWDVLPGVSAPALLAARHRVVLNPVGDAVHVTTARRLGDALAAGQTSIVVMLGGPDWLAGLEGLGGWSVWWGANLGTPSERLAAGRLPAVLSDLVAGRAAARAEAGWVMDLALLEAP